MLKRTQPDPRELHSRLPIDRIHGLVYFKSLMWLQKDLIQLVQTPEGNTKFNHSWIGNVKKFRKFIIRKYSYNTLKLIK